MSVQMPVLAGALWWIEEWSLARSSLPGMGNDKSWNVSTVVDTCRDRKSPSKPQSQPMTVLGTVLCIKMFESA